MIHWNPVTAFRKLDFRLLSVLYYRLASGFTWFTSVIISVAKSTMIHSSDYVYQALSFSKYHL
jgi:hypothetical protein